MSVFKAMGSTPTEITTPHPRHEYAKQRRLLWPRTYPSTSSTLRPGSGFSHFGHFAKAMSISFLKWLLCSDPDHKGREMGAPTPDERVPIGPTYV